MMNEAACLLTTLGMHKEDARSITLAKKKPIGCMPLLLDVAVQVHAEGKPKASAIRRLPPKSGELGI